jgi:hypothetical protein
MTSKRPVTQKVPGTPKSGINKKVPESEVKESMDTPVGKLKRRRKGVTRRTKGTRKSKRKSSRRKCWKNRKGKRVCKTVRRKKRTNGRKKRKS